MRRKTLLATATASALLLGATTAQPPALSERERAIHVLNRLAFGPKPGDVDRIVALGIDRYIEQQLHPERITDSPLELKLERYATLTMSDRQLTEHFIEPLMEARRERRKNSKEEEKGEVRDQRERMARNQRPQRVAFELSSARIERATSSERQLNEVMVDFWMNHFNVFAGKGLDRVLISSYERKAIRPNIWGQFDDLLLATAKSPAMLVYLDNARSVAAPENRSMATAFPGRQNQNIRAGGLNENYARELLELHTLGVDGGYTQKDVTELARLLTGWSMARPGEGEGFIFRAALHDRGAKTILGVHYPAGGGIEEGERFLRQLAMQPATAKRIARKLCQRLVADDPPPSLVDSVAKRYLATRGNIRETVRAIVTSREFFDPRFYRTKVKTPFEYVISAIRATDSSMTQPLQVARSLRDLGEPLYFAQAPTGYSDLAADWISSGALVNRLNFAIALAASRAPGVQTRIAGSSLDELSIRLIGTELSPQTKRTIEQRLRDESVASSTPDNQLQLMAGLILGSPEFQRQ